jgi:hypothetical protein
MIPNLFQFIVFVIIVSGCCPPMVSRLRSSPWISRYISHCQGKPITLRLTFQQALDCMFYQNILQRSADINSQYQVISKYSVAYHSIERWLSSNPTLIKSFLFGVHLIGSQYLYTHCFTTIVSLLWYYINPGEHDHLVYPSC